MKLSIITKKITLTPQEKEYMEKKLSKLDKFFSGETEARVVSGTVKDKEYVEASIFAGGMIYRAEVTASVVNEAVDEIVDIIERQIRKNKTRLLKKIKKDALLDDLLISGDSYLGGEDTEEYKIVKTKRFQVKPMTPDEAVLQMKLLGHNFFVFKNVDTNEMNVVYERHDGNFALIESVE